MYLQLRKGLSAGRARTASVCNQRVVVPIVYVAAMFMSVLDTTIVTVALPSIGRDLHGGAVWLSLVSIAYLVALGVFIPASAWIGDVLGGRRALLMAVGLFTLASLLCGVSTTVPELVAFRVLQGMGGAVMTPVGMAMLFRVFPAAERVRVASIVTVFVSLAPALGPVLGGVFTTYLTWRLAFAINVPVGALIVVIGLRGLDVHEQSRPGRLDVGGLVLSGLGLGSLLYGVSFGPDEGWSSPQVVATIAGGAMLLAVLVLVEARVAEPLIDLRLFANRLFVAATSLYALASAAYIGVLFAAAMFFQGPLGLSAVQSGLITFSSAVGTMIGSQLITRLLYWRVGPRRLNVVGLVVVAAGTALLGQVDAATSLWAARLTLFVIGFGVSFVFVSSQAASMATVNSLQTARASALYNAGKQVGSAIGVALLGTVLVAAGGQSGRSAGAVDPAGFHDAFYAASAIAVLAVVVALTIRDSDAAATMTPPARERNPDLNAARRHAPVGRSLPARPPDAPHAGRG